MTIAFLIVLLLQSAYAQSPGCGKDHSDSSTMEYTIKFDGIKRTYIVHRPSTYDANTPIPFIFGFPGFSMSASYFDQNFGLKRYAEILAQSGQETFLSVIVEATRFPSNGRTLSWNDIGCASSPGPEGATCDGSWTYKTPDGCPNDGCNWCNCHANDVAFIDFLAGVIESNYCIDESREYALGYSQGGMMTQRVGCELNQRFAAIAPFAGQQAIGFNCGPQAENSKIGIINIWGTEDSVVPGDGSVSSDGFWYSSVDDVQKVFAEYNGCNVDDQPSDFVSSVDCDDCDWKCLTYNQGDDCQSTVQCSFNGKHNYPINKDKNNFALPVVWNYFKRFSKPKAIGYCTDSASEVVYDDARKGGKGGGKKRGKGGKMKMKKCDSKMSEPECKRTDGCQWINGNQFLKTERYFVVNGIRSNSMNYPLIGVVGFLVVVFVYHFRDKNKQKRTEFMRETTPLNV